MLLRSNGNKATQRWGTELISLYCRFWDNLRVEPIVNDEIVVKIVHSLNYDFTQLKIPRITVLTTALRISKFDREVLAFLARHPDGTMLSIGCGLETRNVRLDDGRAEWYDLDFPDVIRERKKHFQESVRHRCLGISALDPAWINEIREKKPLSNFIPG